jgi:hypothetical protein
MVTSSHDDHALSDYTASHVAHTLAPTYVPRAFAPAGWTAASALPFFFAEFVDSVGPESDYDFSTTEATIRDLAAYMVQLSARTFGKVGSLTLDGEDVVVGPLRPAWLMEHAGARLGVYNTSAEAKLAQLNHKARLVCEGCLQWARPWSYLSEVVDPVWTYVLILEVIEYVRACPDMNKPQPTYLRHLDDRWGPNFLSRDDGSLAGVVDWEL